MTDVVGIDLSLTATGVARIGSGGVELGTVKSQTTGDALADKVGRLRAIRDEVCDWCIGARLVMIEGPSYGSQGSAVHQIAGNWWLVVSELVSNGWPVGVVSPGQVKKFAAGRGNADKAAVAIGVARLWPDVEPADNNQADALVLASIGAQYVGLAVPRRAHHAKILDSISFPELS